MSVLISALRVVAPVGLLAQLVQAGVCVGVYDDDSNSQINMFWVPPNQWFLTRVALGVEGVGQKKPVTGSNPC